MKIGELLVADGVLHATDAEHLLDKLHKSGQRFASFAVAQGIVQFDDASRALGKLHGVAAALQKHLANRDVACAKLIPAELGRGSFALPIGKTKAGAVIVCVRDPAPALKAALEQAIGGPVLMVVAPHGKLEQLISAAYGEGSDDEMDIDFDAGAEPPPLGELDILDPDSVRLSLTELDDSRVAKGIHPPTHPPSRQSAPAIPRTATKPQTAAPATVAQPSSPRITLPPPPPTLENTSDALDAARTREAATDAVMKYIAGRWVSALVVAIRKPSAIGYRGHNVKVRGGVESISLPLALPSTMQRAVESKRSANNSPAGPAQEQLLKLLDSPTSLVAAPVLVSGEVVATIVVGDPVQGPQDLEGATAALGRLAQLLSSAYDRIRKTTR